MSNTFNYQRRLGKSVQHIIFCKFALQKYGSVLCATTDQKKRIKELREYFPNNVMELVGEWAVRVYQNEFSKSKATTSNTVQS